MKYIAVTGAYGGIGKAVVDILKNNGYFVFALDKEIENEEKNVMPIKTDLTNELSVKNAFNVINSVTDSLYAILHFAGRYVLNSLIEINESDFINTFNVNLFGAYRVNKYFLPLLKKGSKILITTSELAPLDPLPFTGLYAITKTALDKYAYSLRMELQLLDVQVCVLRPGAVKTPMIDVSTSDLDKFCKNSTLYSCNATRFKKIVDGVEAKNVSPTKIANKVLKIINKNKVKQVYTINRNPLLLLLNALPKSLQTKIIKIILK